MPVCASCGQENPDQAKFCLECGAPIAAAARQEERKVVTVLFADLVGFTSRAERMDVEDVHGMLMPYHVGTRSVGVARLVDCLLPARYPLGACERSQRRREAVGAAL